MHVKNIPQNVKKGDKIRVENGAKKDNFGPTERFDNLSKNKGFGEVLHVKNVAEKEEIGNKIEAENANEKDKNVRIEKPILPKNEGQNTWI